MTSSVVLIIRRDFQAAGSKVASDGSSVSITPEVLSPCSSGSASTLSYIIDDVAHTPVQQGLSCVYTPSTPLTDQDTIDASLSGPYSDATNGSLSILSVVTPLGLLGISNGPPTCTADLVSGQVICSGLNSGSFSVAVGSGTPVALGPIPNSGLVGSQSAFVPGLAPGKTVELFETTAGPNGGLRALTTLHLSTLEVQSTPTGSTITCQPGEAALTNRTW